MISKTAWALITGGSLFACGWIGGAFAAGEPDNVAAAQKLLETRCYECHGPRVQKSGLRLDDRAAALKGGDSAKPLITPGNVSESLLIKAVLGEVEDMPAMPPKGERLTEAEVTLLRDWIQSGAAWPAGMKTADPRAHWAYQAPQWPKVPAVSEPAWVRNPIDAFILARLDREGLKHAPEADRRTLIRRASLDLTGLPPGPDEVEAFVNDPDPQAYEKLVDRLLASPAYGERWAAPWLDLARYADSNGFEKDDARQIWPYRDWVIRALNADMPFDEFVTQQLAGDMLPGATRDQIIATGFNRNSMINEEGGVDSDEAQAKAIHDRVGTTSTAFLATTMACAQCHSHKYDPISQEEYYRFYAIFNRQDSDFRVLSTTASVNGGPNVAVPSPEQERLIMAVAAERRAVEDQMQSNAQPREKLIERLWELSAIGPRGVPTSMVMRESETPRESYIHKGGDFHAKGATVEPGIPAVWPPLPEGVPVNRLSLARWLTSPANPLTARVFVNRVWDQDFGLGIVRTVEDFGTQGERPVHPELLDWLALTFQWQGWSMKSLHRIIMTSAAYRQDSATTPEKIEHDPENRLLAHGPRMRLPAEMIRDQALRAGGLLSAKMFGPSVFPNQPPGIWKMPYSARVWRESAGEDRFRRGVYTWWQRTAAYPSFLAFDAPTREAACTRRTKTNSPTQALVTLNDPVYMEASQGLARRVLGIKEPDERIARMFRICLARAPQPREATRLRDYLDTQLAGFHDDPAAAKSVAMQGSLDAPPEWIDLPELAAWTMVASVILNLDETLNKN